MKIQKVTLLYNNLIFIFKISTIQDTRTWHQSTDEPDFLLASCVFSLALFVMCLFTFNYLNIFGIDLFLFRMVINS